MVVLRYYSGEVENVDISLRQICSGNYTPNVVEIGQVFKKIWCKRFGLLLLGHDENDRKTWEYKTLTWSYRIYTTITIKIKYWLSQWSLLTFSPVLWSWTSFSVSSTPVCSSSWWLLILAVSVATPSPVQTDTFHCTIDIQEVNKTIGGWWQWQCHRAGALRRPPASPGCG